MKQAAVNPDKPALSTLLIYSLIRHQLMISLPAECCCVHAGCLHYNVDGDRDNGVRLARHRAQYLLQSWRQSG